MSSFPLLLQLLHTVQYLLIPPQYILSNLVSILLPHFAECGLLNVQTTERTSNQLLIFPFLAWQRRRFDVLGRVVDS